MFHSAVMVFENDETMLLGIDGINILMAGKLS